MKKSSLGTILFSILVLSCIVSPAMGIAYPRNINLEGIHFLLSELEFTTENQIHERLTNKLKSGGTFIKQPCCVLLIKTLGKSGYLYSLIFLIILLLLYYRKYEISRIKKRTLIHTGDTKADWIKNACSYELNQLEKEEEGLDNFFTPISGSPCFVLSSGDKPAIDFEERDVLTERDILRNLLSNINRDTFCNSICHVKQKCYYPYIKSFLNNSFGNKPLERNSFPDELTFRSKFSFAMGTNENSLLPGEFISLKDEEFLGKTLSIMNSKSSDYRFSVHHLAGDLNMSISQLNRKMNLLAGYPSGKLIRNFRLHKAAGLLLKNKVSVSEACFSAGFNDLSYFSRTFKKQFGCSPSEYKRRMIKKC